MRKGALVVTVVLLTLAMSSGIVSAQTFLIARLGQKDVATYHLVEVFQQRGHWIYPDIGYIDFADAGRYRETFIGGGAELYKSKRFTIIEEAYLNVATGPASNKALYFFPWTYVGFKITSMLSGEAVYFPYLPLNDAGTIQHVVEHIKIEYDFGHFKVGGGYGAYQFGDGPWQDRPFLTGTMKLGRFGDLELWLQRLPESDEQVQIRYFKVF